MSAKKLLVLIVIAALLGGLAYLSSKSRQGGTVDDVLGKPLLAKFKEADVLNSIEKISFQSVESTVTVARVDGVWVAPTKYNYPVDFGKVRDFVRKIAELKIGQTVLSSDAQLASLELLPPTGADADAEKTGTLVEFRNSSDGLVAAMIVGKQRTKSAAPGSQYGGYPDGRFVAVDGKAFIVSDALHELPENAKSWLDEDLANINSSDIVEITVSGPEGDPLHFKRPDGGGDLELAGLSSDKEEMNTSKVNSLAGVLGWMRFNDVADPALTDEQTGLDKAITYTAVTKKGPVYTLKLGGSPEGTSDRYIQLSAAYSPAEEVAEKKADDQDEEARKKAEEEATKKKEKQAKLAQEIADLNAKVGAWTYVISSYKVDSLSTKRSDFVNEKEEEKKDETEDKAEDAAVTPEEDEKADGEE